MERMNNSAERIALPNFDGEQLTELIKKLVQVDKKWIPTEKGYSLYIRELRRAQSRVCGCSGRERGLRAERAE
jgi:branched-chain amino acid aminotransferase